MIRAPIGNPRGTVVAYNDNAAVLEGTRVTRFYPRSDTRGVDGFGTIGVNYAAADELTHTVFKVETHNHPTAISPYPGASTGSGGEIRDEGATGRGAKPKAGLCRLFGVEPAHSRSATGVGERPRRDTAGRRLGS